MEMRWAANGLSALPARTEASTGGRACWVKASTMNRENPRNKKDSPAWWRVVRRESVMPESGASTAVTTRMTIPYEYWTCRVSI